MIQTPFSGHALSDMALHDRPSLTLQGDPSGQHWAGTFKALLVTSSPPCPSYPPPGTPPGSPAGIT